MDILLWLSQYFISQYFVGYLFPLMQRWFFLAWTLQGILIDRLWNLRQCLMNRSLLNNVILDVADLAFSLIPQLLKVFDIWQPNQSKLFLIFLISQNFLHFQNSHTTSSYLKEFGGMHLRSILLRFRPNFQSSIYTM